MKRFPIATILTVYHNKMMSTFDEMRELLDYMTGHRVALWEIPRARVLCRDALEKQFYWLPQMPMPIETRKDTSPTFVRKVKRAVGEDDLEVRPLRKNAFTPHSFAEQGPWAKRKRA